MILLIFFLANLGIILLLLLYPVIAWFRSLIFKKPILKSEAGIQPVSIIIACSNEELFIRRKLDSFLDPEEWIEGSEIIVVVNNSTDSTGTILKEYEQNRKVIIIIEPEHSSKIKSVNKAVGISKNELLVFSDCRQQMMKGSVRSLIKNFSDPSVGTVNSTLSGSSADGRNSFRTLLNFISQCESRSGSSLNLFGALYAQRKSVFKEIPTDILFDDLFVVVSTLLQKKRLISEKDAVIYDISFEDYYKKNRTRRLARGLLIFLFNHYGMIRKLPFLTYIRFLIFKYSKLVVPFALVFLFMDIIYLLYHTEPRYQLIFLIALTLLVVFRSTRRILTHLASINYNFGVATIQFLFFNNRSNKWDKLEVAKTPTT